MAGAQQQPASLSETKSKAQPPSATDIDTLLAETLDEAPTATIADPLVVDREDWKPERGTPADAQKKAPPAEKTAAIAPPAPEPTPEAGPASKSSPAAVPASKPSPKVVRGQTDVDPEPDGAITVPADGPSHDPLDKPRTPTKSDAGPNRPDTAAQPGKTETGKTDTNKTDAGKQAEQPLPPLNAAIKAALDKRGSTAPKGVQAVEAKKERDAIAFFYASHGFAPAWSKDNKPIASVDPVLARLSHADEDALTLSSTPKTLKVDGDLKDQADSDIAISEAVVAYARQATGGRIDPHTISPLIGYKPDLADPAEVLDKLIGAGADAGTTLQALNPDDPRYAALRHKLGELRAQGTLPAAKDIPPGPTLRTGMRDSRVPLIRARLNLDALPADDAAASKYDADVAAAVADFQRANSLPASGNLTKATVAALSIGRPAHAEATIIANMEMWRWLPRDAGQDRIEVNVPDYIVTVFHDGQSVSENRVVVGKTDTPTPLFANTMKFLIVNPVWNVPQSIIQNEMGGEPRAGFTARYVHGRLFLQQASGPGNALGRIKFMFPNPYSVYLHDTPAKHLFSTARRAYSHGCVRVDKPFDFAEIVLNQTVPEGSKMLWSQQRLQKMLGTTERYVDLPKPLPIHIQYFTASVDDTGTLKTREDIYGYTRAVAAALGQDAGPVPPPPRVAAVKSAARVAERRARRARRLENDDSEVVTAAPPPQQSVPGWFGNVPFW